MDTRKKYPQWVGKTPLLWVWAWIRVITRKFRWVWVRVRALYYPDPQPAYTYLYNIINILFIFGVQLLNLFSYLSINAHGLKIYDLNQFDVYFSMHFFICILNVFILIFEEYFG
jgi:hypothetical protein